MVLDSCIGTALRSSRRYRKLCHQRFLVERRVASNMRADYQCFDRTGTIKSENFVKGAIYAEDSKTDEKNWSQIHSKVPAADDDMAEGEIGDSFEFGSEESDFASAFVPQGFKAVLVESEDDEPCRLVFPR